MSLRLPPRPNLEHLKKQAKDRLRAMQQQDPAATLIDAQHALARDYGFPSWPKLKAHVESLAPKSEPATAVFHRYTERARRATFFSRYEAGQLGHVSIEPEDLLVGVVQARLGLTSRLLASPLLSPTQIRSDVAARTRVQAPLPRSMHIAFNADSGRILQYAVEEADRLQHHDIATAHLLLGILREEGSIAASILREHGLSLQAVREEIGDLLNGEVV